MFILTLVDLEYETSVSLWEFEMMIVLKWYLCLHFSSLQKKFTNTHENVFINENNSVAL